MSNKHKISDSFDDSSLGKKQAKTEVSPSSFEAIGDDLLRTILLRTRASDHMALKRTCRRFWKILDSPLFRRERGEQGFAEVEVRKLSAFEIYARNKKEEREDRRYEGDTEVEQEDEAPPDEEDDEFKNNYNHLGNITGYIGQSFETRDFEVFVDGLPLHKRYDGNTRYYSGTRFLLNVRLLPREYHTFWAMGNACNPTVQSMVTTLFTNLSLIHISEPTRRS